MNPQKSPKPGIKITILTEADITKKINNKKNNEVDMRSGGTNMNMEGMNMQGMSNFFGNMAKSNPYIPQNNGMFKG
jgi:hypothetical protein